LRQLFPVTFIFFSADIHASPRDPATFCGRGTIDGKKNGKAARKIKKIFRGAHATRVSAMEEEKNFFPDATYTAA
jgi:hypothetical protein